MSITSFLNVPNLFDKNSVIPIFLFRDQGFHVDLVKYTDEKTSMENRLLCINV